MRFDIHLGRAKREPGLEEHVRTRLFHALDRFRSRLEEVLVRFDDLNGPRSGGSDQLCRIRVRVRGLPEFVVEDRAGDAASAVDLAAHRMRKVVARAVERINHRPARRLAS